MTSDHMSAGAARPSSANGSIPSSDARRYSVALASITSIQRRARDRANAARKSGIGSPVTVLASSADAISSGPPTISSRACSSTRCCVPTRSARRRPSRIHRRIVSGFLPTRRAASGTVNTVVVYYNTTELTGGMHLLETLPSTATILELVEQGWPAVGSCLCLQGFERNLRLSNSHLEPTPPGAASGKC